jgi:hypothetical protein
MNQRMNEGHTYAIARICRGGVEAGAVYAGAVPCEPDALVAEVVSKSVVLRRGAGEQRARVALSVAETLAVATACRVWQEVRPGFTSSRVRVDRGMLRGLVVDAADRGATVRRHAVPARAVGAEVLIVAELRIVDGREHAGALAGAIYAMPGDWTLEVTAHGAWLARGAERIHLRAGDAGFLEALGRTLSSETRVPAPKPAHEMTEEEIAEAFRV